MKLNPVWFSPDYWTARQRFRSLVNQTGGRLSVLELSCPHEGESPLSIDIGWFGSADPKRVIMHVSGTHGIEGYAGSAIQLSSISARAVRPGRDEAVIYVHVLNPYGMAYLRRVNERNVDLNRNFLPEGQAFRGVSDGYVKMQEILNPSTPPGFDFFLLRSGIKILQHGYNQLKQAITEGQYDYPKGLFYGGAELEEGPRLYLHWLRSHLARADHVTVIDVHTGLGPSGEDALLVDTPHHSDEFKRLTAAYGSRVAAWDPNESLAYQIHGGHPAGVTRTLDDSKVEFITQEFGTISALKVLHALREENRLHHWGEPSSWHTAKQGLLDAFRPNTETWRRQVLSRGQTLITQAVDRTFTGDESHVNQSDR